MMGFVVVRMIVLVRRDSCGESGPMRRTRLRLRDYRNFIVSAMPLRDGRDGMGMGKLAYPRRVSVSLWFSPSISKILIVLSDEQVARRRP